MLEQAICYRDAVTRVIDYIEGNLSEDLCVNKLSDIACMSPFHFHRIFAKVTGEKVADYIIKRRLTRSAFDLLDSDKPIIHIAMDYGFNSQEVFTRSFKKNFNITPKKYRDQNNVKLLYIKTKLDFETLLPNSYYRFEESKKFRITGYRVSTSVDDGKTMTAIYDLFVKLQTEYARLNYPLAGKRVYLYKKDIVYPDKENRIVLFLGIDFNGEVPEGMTSFDIPDCRYVVFDHTGAIDKIHKTYDMIYSELLPNMEVDIDYTFSLNIFSENMFNYFFNNQEDTCCKSEEMRDWYMFKSFFSFEIYLPLKS